MGTLPVLKPLAISCTSSDCENGLHCFRQAGRRRNTSRSGNCRTCGADLVDWNRVHRREVADAANTFANLKREMIRHHFWHTPIDLAALNHARRKGLHGLQGAAEQRIRQSVGSAQPYRDGTQTGYSGNILYYAQHATASCCRKCIEEWHGIPTGRTLTEDEIRYLTELVLLYVKERLPQLSVEGETVPFMRQSPTSQRTAAASARKRQATATQLRLELTDDQH